MGPLSGPEQHTLAFRSNALTSAHPGQTKCLCAAFPLLGPAPTPTSPARPRPPEARGARGSARRDPSLCRTGRTGCLPQETRPSRAARPSRMDGTGHWSRGPALRTGGPPWGWVALGTAAVTPAISLRLWCQQQQRLRGHRSCPACAAGDVGESPGGAADAGAALLPRAGLSDCALLLGHAGGDNNPCARTAPVPLGPSHTVTLCPIPESKPCPLGFVPSLGWGAVGLPSKPYQLGACGLAGQPVPSQTPPPPLSPRCEHPELGKRWRPKPVQQSCEDASCAHAAPLSPLLP